VGVTAFSIADFRFLIANRFRERRAAAPRGK
jgi:hypothetical protein